MRHGEIRTVRVLNPKTVEKLDPKTTHVYFLSGIPRFEISKTGETKYLFRPFGTPASEPFLPANSRTVKELTMELFEEYHK